MVGVGIKVEVGLGLGVRVGVGVGVVVRGCLLRKLYVHRMLPVDGIRTPHGSRAEHAGGIACCI